MGLAVIVAVAVTPRGAEGPGAAGVGRHRGPRRISSRAQQFSDAGRRSGTRVTVVPGRHTVPPEPSAPRL